MNPPFRRIIWPVTHCDSLLTRNSTTLEISSSSPKRPKEFIFPTLAILLPTLLRGEHNVVFTHPLRVS